MTDAYQPHEASRRPGHSPADDQPAASAAPSYDETAASASDALGTDSSLTSSTSGTGLAGSSGAGGGRTPGVPVADPIGGAGTGSTAAGSSATGSSGYGTGVGSVTGSTTSGNAGYGSSGSGSSGSGSTGGVKDTAKEEAANLGGTAKEEAANLKESATDAGRRVAGTAKQDAAHVVGEAKQQARQLLDQTMHEVRDQAGTQQRRLADGVSTFGSDLRGMADGNAPESGLAAQIVREVADRAEGAASWLSNREPADLLEEVKTFARRRPGTFIAIAGVAGLLVGRLARGMVSEARASSGSSDSTTGPEFGGRMPAVGTTGGDGGATRGVIVDGDVPAQTGHSPHGTGADSTGTARVTATGTAQPGPAGIGHSDPASDEVQGERYP